MPRIIGFLFDFIHDAGWMCYTRYLKKIGIGGVQFGDCHFLCDNNDLELVNKSLGVLEANCPEVAGLLRKSPNVSFIINGAFPGYSRAANFKFLIHRNTANYGVDGVLSVIGFGFILETERRKRGTLCFRLFSPDMDEVKSLWIDWLKKQEIDTRLIEFYESQPLQKI